MDSDAIKAYFGSLGLNDSYDRFTQVSAGALITVPAADAVAIQTDQLVSVMIVPIESGSPTLTFQVNHLFVMDTPFASLTISVPGSATAIVRVNGFTQDQSN